MPLFGMEKLLPVANWLAEIQHFPVLDVRSPSEFVQGHIPQAHNMPLFSDEERAQVGTVYKQQGPQSALELGLELVGPKMAYFVREAARLAPDRVVGIHCWRGGKRSQSVAWLLGQAGFRVTVLQGGYKAYRHYVLSAFAEILPQLLVVGGRTGTGKTKILHALRDLGEQIIDLEALAHHKGSAFGFIGEAAQPTVEQFENDLAAVLCTLDTSRRIWVENESRSIGRVYLPEAFWKQKKAAPLFNIDVPPAQRIQNLIGDYTVQDKSALESAFQRIAKKLGGLRHQQALEALHQDDFATAAEIALTYYDKTYQHCLDVNESPVIQHLNFESASFSEMAAACIAAADKMSYAH